MKFLIFLHTVPEAPTSVKALVMSAESILVSWRPPTQPNGVIAQYTVYTKTNNSEQPTSEKIPPTQLTHEVTTLEDGRKYDFWVTASTNIGEGQPSKIVSITPSASGKNFGSYILQVINNYLNTYFFLIFLSSCQNCVI